MCGRLNVTDDPRVIALCDALGIELFPEGYEPPQMPLVYGRFIRAASKVALVREKEGKRELCHAIWWLLLEPTESGFKPSKYTSFNTRYDKLNMPRSAGYKAFRESRCIIPVTGFGETEGKGASARYTDFESPDAGIALGGLCREWRHQATGQVVLSCSVITLPPHPKLETFHTKASPLILPQNDDTMNMWLDGSLKDVSLFQDLLTPRMPQPLLATQIDKPSTYQAVGESVLLEKD